MVNISEEVTTVPWSHLESCENNWKVKPKKSNVTAVGAEGVTLFCSVHYFIVCEVRVCFPTVWVQFQSNINADFCRNPSVPEVKGFCQQKYEQRHSATFNVRLFSFSSPREISSWPSCDLAFPACDHNNSQMFRSSEIELHIFYIRVCTADIQSSGRVIVQSQCVTHEWQWSE